MGEIMKEQKAIVLMYHQIVPEDSPEGWIPSRLADPAYGVGVQEFTHQMAYLQSSGFCLTSLDGWFRSLGSPDSSKNPAIIITFDDGYESDCSLAAPILSNLGIPATFFVSTGHLGLKGMMTESNVQALSQNSLFDVGAHGASHAFLTTLSNEDCLSELKLSIARIRDLTGERKVSMSAPGGRVNSSVVHAVRNSGFFALMTSRPGVLYPGLDPFSIPRLPVMARHSLKNFKQLLNPHSWTFRFDYWVRSTKQSLRNMGNVIGLEG